MIQTCVDVEFNLLGGVMAAKSHTTFSAYIVQVNFLFRRVSVPAISCLKFEI